MKFQVEGYEVELDKKLFIKSQEMGDNREVLTVVKSAALDWEIQAEFRDWGVKSLYVHCPDQPVDLEVEFENDEGDEFTELVTISIKDVKTKLVKSSGEDDDENISGQFAVNGLVYDNDGWTLVVEVC